MPIDMIAAAILLGIAFSCFIFLRKNRDSNILITLSGHKLKCLDINVPSKEKMEQILKGKYALVYSADGFDKYLFIEDSHDRAIKRFEKYTKIFETMHANETFLLRLPNGEILSKIHLIDKRKMKIK